MLDVEKPACLVGPFEEPAHAGEVPGLAMRHRAVGGAGDELAGPLDLVDELARVGEIGPGRRGAADGEIALVDLLPHRGADHVAHRAGILPGRLEAAVDGIGIGGIEGEEVEDAGLIGQAVAIPEV